MPGLLKESSPQDNDNVHADYGPTDYDVRNYFVLNGVWQMPWLQLSRMRGSIDSATAGWLADLGCLHRLDWVTYQYR